jgi:hypothetical protein
LDFNDTVQFKPISRGDMRVSDISIDNCNRSVSMKLEIKNIIYFVSIPSAAFRQNNLISILIGKRNHILSKSSVFNYFINTGPLGIYHLGVSEKKPKNLKT